MRPYAFGADVGGTTVKIGFFRTDGTLIKDLEIKTNTVQGGRAILPDICDAIIKMMREADICADDVEGVGIGAPGAVRPDGTIAGAVNLGWESFDLEETFSALLSGRLEAAGLQRAETTGPLCVKAANDANAAALGEMWKGGGAGCPDMVMVTLGTGVGGGVIANGRIVTGSSGAGGEIGHIPIAEPEDEPEACGCGKHGCFEQYASARGLVNLARRYCSAHPDKESILRDVADLTAKEVFAAAAEGDAPAIAIREQYFSILGRGLASVTAVVNPQRYVIGGGVSKAGTVLIDGIAKYHEIYAFQPARQVQFVLAELGNLAGIYGCCRLVLE